VRCGRCGNENGEANRFCGMCGAPLVGKTQTAGQSAGQAEAENIAVPGPTAVPVQSGAQQAPVAPYGAGPKTGPVITGPSFLGLNLPADAGPRAERHPHGGHDALQPSSRNLDYLLEDEEEPKRGWSKLILIVVALALAVGFGYLHWKRGGFDWLNGGTKKPAAAATTTPEAGQSGADSGGTTGTAATSDGMIPQAGTGGASTTPTTGGAGANPAGSTGPQATAAPATAPQGAASQSATPQSVPPPSIPPQSIPPQSIPPQSKPSDSSVPADSASRPGGSDSDKQSTRAEAPAVPKAPARKPAAAKPVDMVTEAERYIYGRGVRQDCDHGLRLLKPAAEQSNAKAMISLGALYSTGTCTPRDLPTAYRWFALALHKEPDNQALQDDLQKLWGQMTQPERQLAIKLSQ
jgi:hypothetical protein